MSYTSTDATLQAERRRVRREMATLARHLRTLEAKTLASDAFKRQVSRAVARTTRRIVEFPSLNGREDSRVPACAAHAWDYDRDQYLNDGPQGAD